MNIIIKFILIILSIVIFNFILLYIIGAIYRRFKKDSFQIRVDAFKDKFFKSK